MRIILDGSCGSGKTTFLTEIKNRIAENKIGDMQVFTELIKESINEGKSKGICPPRNDFAWESLFNLIFERGISQYESSSFNGIAWLDRGLPFLSVFAKEHDKKISDVMFDKIMKYKYDCVFLVEPIPSLDLSTANNGKFRLFSLEERFASYEMTYQRSTKSPDTKYTEYLIFLRIYIMICS